MKKIAVVLFAMSLMAAKPANNLIENKLYVFESGEISFFSSTPVEDIQANTKTFAAALNPENRKFAFSVYMVSFEFEKKLMQEHFNENYMESEKYPK
ncbi:MAG: YceI family protein, partial [Bacteroidota bacterium]|nr:YceI family protein [Bacteroidota bacterium]MDX5431017.1 YceI family protein [Bacteroidota bacterium]MDX5469768.1 YceI family protein [Bacteroidota bacterium]